MFSVELVRVPRLLLLHYRWGPKLASYLIQFGGVDDGTGEEAGQATLFAVLWLVLICCEKKVLLAGAGLV